jgi:uncharacterized protein YutE (UPF0331/DUF86 family)
MADSVIINKCAGIERCLIRIREDYDGHEKDFTKNFMRQDAIILNIQRACEQTIDLANHLVKINQLDIPQKSKDVFITLASHRIIPDGLMERLVKMVSFRNIAVHEYDKLNLEIVSSIVEDHLMDFKAFIRIASKFA